MQMAQADVGGGGSNTTTTNNYTPGSGGTQISSVQQLLAYGDAAGSRHGTSDKSYSNVSTISYNDAVGPQKVTSYGDSKWLDPLVKALRKCNIIGLTVENTGQYDSQMRDAIAKFQTTHMGDQLKFDLCKYGVLNDLTVKMIFDYANGNCPDYIDITDGSYIGNEDKTPSDSPHYQPFFHKDNGKQFRQNHKNIQIIFGNSGIIKTLHDVVMRSVGVEVDTSGNPISETYEFIARDVTETDEKKDKEKYKQDNGVSSSDIQYKFNFYDFDN